MSAIRKTDSPLLQRGSPMSAGESYDARRPFAGGARLSEAEYESWLLPPEPRNSLEKTIHVASLAAGVIALTGGASLLWFAL